MRMQRIRNIGLALIVPAVVLAAWVAATASGGVPASILPSPATVAGTLGAYLQDGTLAADLGISLLRVVEGYAVAVVLGIVFGAVMGMSSLAERILLPTFTTIRQIPIMAWIPLIILWAGIGEESKVVIIALAAYFPIMTNTLAGFASTPREYIEVARLYRLGPWKTFRRVYLPHALPHIQTGLKLGLGVSWMVVVAAELVAATSGVGYRLSYARSLMQSDVVIAYIVMVGLVGIVMDKAVSVVFDLLTPWERKEGRA